MPEERLYIKLILPKQGRDKKVQPGGSEAVPFKKITPDFTKKLLQMLDHAVEALKAEPSHLKIIPLHVFLEKEALAKSHRPTELFNETWRIVHKRDALWHKRTYLQNQTPGFKKTDKSGFNDQRIENSWHRAKVAWAQTRRHIRKIPGYQRI
jgi:hypothetical protein